MAPKISVVIPTRNSESTIESCLTSLSRNKDIDEIIIVDDSDDRTREIASKYAVKVVYAPGKNISEARNLGVNCSTGDVVAFTDDDCVVPEDWVEKACKYFNDLSVGAVGGPNLTPKNSSFRERCAGMVLGSWFGTAISVRRYSIVDNEANSREVDESRLITCNLFLRRAALNEVGLFNPNQFPCEENELLHRIKRRAFKLLYVSSLYVWHKRRPIFLPFARQIYCYGVGRALFLKRSASSFKLIHAIPSIFVIGLVLGFILSFGFSFWLYGSAVLLYFLLAAIASTQMVAAEKQNPVYVLPLMLTFFLNHIAYGIGFIRGLFKAARD